MRAATLDAYLKYNQSIQDSSCFKLIGRTGISKGETLGMEGELAEARRVLEEEKALIRKELQEAIGARDAKRLKRAIDRGEALNLKPGELTEANRVLKELNKEAWAS